MADLDKIAEAARSYARFINATGQRFSHQETTLFCEAIEAADAPPPAIAAPAVIDEPAPAVKAQVIAQSKPQEA